jgi:NDP-sugar pyrophosphorylase family protein
MNGDSFLEVDFDDLIDLHRRQDALASIALWRAANAARYGTVCLGAHDRVIEFAEKTGRDSPGLINGGVYVFSRAVLQHIPEGDVSLERDVFPKLLDQGVYGRQQHGLFIDIGTPEDYALAQPLYYRLENAALRGPRSSSSE